MLGRRWVLSVWTVCCQGSKCAPAFTAFPPSLAVSDNSEPPWMGLRRVQTDKTRLRLHRLDAIAIFLGVM